MTLSAAQTVECLHLGVLATLRTRLGEDRYVLKGGANLRYFFRSIRYSEDIDLDFRGVDGWKLEEQVDKALASESLKLILRSAGVQIDTAGISKPKQTNTTRRWKVAVIAPGMKAPVRTKIEFSNRNGDDRFSLEAVPDSVVKPYAMRAPSVQHYLFAPAVEQKVRALAGRPETQARDVFDLDLLFRSASPDLTVIPAETREAAAEAGLALPFQAFQDQVLPFLEPSIADQFDQDSWLRMQEQVIKELLA